MPSRLITAAGQERQYERQLGDLNEAGVIPCFRCGVCCERWQPLIGREEAARIARRLGIGVEEFLSQYARPYPLREETWQLKNNGRACVFLRYEDDELTTCTIHEDRPDACRDWLAALSRKECVDGLRRVSPGKRADEQAGKEQRADGEAQIVLLDDLRLEGEDRREMVRAIKYNRGDASAQGER